MTPEEIKQLIESAIDGAVADVRSEDNVHFEARIVSGQFSGKRTVARHQMVYGALGSRMGNEIHALSMQTLAPEETG